MDAEASPTAGIDYFYESPSAWPFVIFWTLCPLLALATWVISWMNIIGHRKSAHKAGLGQSWNIWSYYTSFGVRVDLTSDLLVLPMIYSLTGCLDVFRPELADFMIFIRTVFMAKALVQTVKLYFIRSSGWKPLFAGLEANGPVKPKAPPLCCIFGWPCCARKVTAEGCHPWSFSFNKYGVMQFTVFGPLFAILNIVLKNNAVLTGGADRRIQYTTAAASIYTTLSVWCYRNLAEYFGPVIQKICLDKGDDTFNPKEANFVVLHYLFASLTNLVLNLAVRDGHDNGNWVMHRTTLATMINGFATCIVEFLLAIMATKLFPHNETSYPPLCDATEQLHKGLPLDTLPLLQMFGVATSQWEVFQVNRRVTTVVDGEPSPASNRPTKPRAAPEAEEQAAAAQKAAAKAGAALDSGDAAEVADAANLLGFLGSRFVSEALKAKLEGLRSHENKEVQDAVAEALGGTDINVADLGQVKVQMTANI